MSSTNSLINGSIELSLKQVQDALVKHSNGKTYLNFVIQLRKEVGKFGDTHSISLAQTKEQREAKADKVYIGTGKEFVFGKQQNQVAQEPDVQDDDLPF